MNTAPPTVRGFRSSDVAVAGEICYSAFRKIAEAHGFIPDFPSPQVAAGLLESLASRPDVVGLVAEHHGEVIGSNFVMLGDVGGIGPITVKPDSQDSGAGRLLMEATIAEGSRRHCKSHRLVQAAYHTRSLSLYAKLGFDAVEPLAVLQGAAIHKKVANNIVRKATATDIPAAAALCKQLHGISRELEIRLAVNQGTARVVERAGIVVGYTTQMAFFGHSVAQDASALCSLIADAEEFAGPGILVPIRNSEVFQWSLNNGLRVMQTMTLMSRGPYEKPYGAYLPSVLF